MGALAEKMGIEFTEFSIERSVATMPVEGNTQPVGLLHGGAYVVLGESLGSMAANLHAGPVDSPSASTSTRPTRDRPRAASSRGLHALCISAAASRCTRSS
jgi:acyl-coenzyme A thioesterase PaaI-like protein